MKSFFRKVAIMGIAVFSMNVAVSAQEAGDMAIGGNLVFGMGDSYSNIGIGPKFQYNVTAPIRLEGSFTYFLKKDNVSMWDMSANVHYLFPIAENVAVYPLAGLSILGSKVHIPKIDLGEAGTIDASSSSTSDLGFNFGGGIDYLLTETLTLNAEVKYKIVEDWDRTMISVGLAYRF